MSKEKIFLSDYSKKDKKWDNHKFAAVKVNEFYSSSHNDVHQRYGERIRSCAELLRFSFIDNFETGETQLKLANAQFCRVRLCPVCQWRRSMVWRAKFFQKLPDLLKVNNNLNFLFLTLTVKNCDISDLSETLNLMNSAFSKLRKRKEFENISLGFIKSTEVTKSKNNTAHPHFHLIVAVSDSYFRNKNRNRKDGKNFITTEKWSELWKECLKVDYYPVVDARKVRKVKGEVDSKAVIETLKYTTKIKDLLDDKSWFLMLSDQLFKKRFISTGGIFKNILSDEVSGDEMLLLDENKLEKEIEEFQNSIYFSFDKSKKKYKKTDI